MPWTLRLIDNPGPDKKAWDALQVGDCYFQEQERITLNNLSDQYHAENSNRRPLVVILPGRNFFCVDSKCFNEKGLYGGWVVKGIPPKITVTPSINAVGRYHGFITNGIISDDCEGRKF